MIFNFRKICLGISLLIWAGFLSQIVGDVAGIDSFSNIAVSSIIAFVGGIVFYSGLRRGF